MPIPARFMGVNIYKNGNYEFLDFVYIYLPSTVYIVEKNAHQLPHPRLHITSATPSEATHHISYPIRGYTSHQLPHPRLHITSATPSEATHHISYPIRGYTSHQLPHPRLHITSATPSEATHHISVTYTTAL